MVAEVEAALDEHIVAYEKELDAELKENPAQPAPAE